MAAGRADSIDVRPICAVDVVSLTLGNIISTGVNDTLFRSRIDLVLVGMLTQTDIVMFLASCSCIEDVVHTVHSTSGEVVADLQSGLGSRGSFLGGSGALRTTGSRRFRREWGGCGS